MNLRTPSRVFSSKLIDLTGFFGLIGGMFSLKSGWELAPLSGWFPAVNT